MPEPHIPVIGMCGFLIAFAHSWKTPAIKRKNITTYPPTCGNPGIRHDDLGCQIHTPPKLLYKELGKRFVETVFQFMRN